MDRYIAQCSLLFRIWMNYINTLLTITAWTLKLMLAVITHPLSSNDVAAMSLDNYNRVKVIGKGSYGEVWLSKHKTDRKQVYGALLENTSSIEIMKYFYVISGLSRIICSFRTPKIKFVYCYRAGLGNSIRSCHFCLCLSHLRGVSQCLPRQLQVP